MKMKKHMIPSIMVILAGLLLLTVGCAKQVATPAAPAPAPAVVPTVAPVAPAAVATYKDGIYFAADEAFASSGWKEVVTIEVKNGKIANVDWNAVNLNGTADKKTYDKAGKYNMVKFGKAQAEWYQQAEKAEAYLIATQDPAKITYKDDQGHTDDIAGVSIHVNALFDLAKKALAAGPVGRGPYADGAYFAIDESYPSSGWKEYVAFTVLNGRIAAVNWSAVNKTGDDKKPYDKAGKYNMVKFGKAQAEWYQQAEKAEAYLIATQDPKKITYKDDQGHSDDIAGVSIHVNALFNLVEKALAAGPTKLGKYADGGYYASEDAFVSGWKGYASLFVSNGNIVSVYWSALSEANEDKKAYDMAGKYNMVKFGKAQAEWYVQAEKAEAYLIATQDPKRIAFKDEAGHTDDIAGVSINVSDFYTLVEKALAAGVKKY
jgi:major membrane immunogen (membrane-anchored lipoprotein)